MEPERTVDDIIEIKTSCHACIAQCGVIATVKNGIVTNLRGNPEDPMSKGRLCAKGLAGIQALYHPDRIRYPMKRIGPRGSGKWERISWEEAIDTIAHKLMDVREKYGAECVFASTGGGGNPELWSIVRFCNIFGTPNWFEPGCAQCYLPRVLAYRLMYGGAAPSIADSNALELYFTDDTPIQALVLWGTDPSYSCPASGGGMLSDLRSKGVKTVVIDPRFTPDAAKSDVWLPIRPGTDVALELSWIRYIIENELYDREFVLNWTNLPYLVDAETKMFLHMNKNNQLIFHENGEDNYGPDTYVVFDRQINKAVRMPFPNDKDINPCLFGEWVIEGRKVKTGFQMLWETVLPYTLEKTSDICGLKKHMIEKAIRIFTENTPGGLCLGVATDQNPNSVQAAMAACIIDSLMGNVERPGSIMQRFQRSKCFDKPQFLVPPASSKLPPEQLKKRLGGRQYKGLGIWWAGHAASILDAILTGKPYKPRVWIERSGNKMCAVADAQKWEKAINELDFIVHMYMYPTSFSCYADILLPAQEWLETNMIVEVCNTLVARQQVTHLYETMDETLFWSLLAKRCGELGHEICAKSFDPEYMGDDMPYWADMEEFLSRFTGRIGMTWKEFKAKAPFEYMPLEQWKSYYMYLKPDKNNHPSGFATPSKKLELYCEQMIRLGKTGKPFSQTELDPADDEYEPLPYYTEPSESPLDHELSKEYPLTFTGGRIPYFHHNTLKNVPWTRELYPVPEVWINPDDAEKYMIRSGDWVWIESRRGKIRSVANVTSGIRPGTIYMERFTTPETLNSQSHGWKDLNVNVLTKADGPYNKETGTYTLRAFQVKIYKADEAPQGIFINAKDFKQWLPVYSERTLEPDLKKSTD